MVAIHPTGSSPGSGSLAVMCSATRITLAGEVNQIATGLSTLPSGVRGGLARLALIFGTVRRRPQRQKK